MVWMIRMRGSVFKNGKQVSNFTDLGNFLEEERDNYYDCMLLHLADLYASNSR